MPAYARAHTRATPQHSDLSQDAPSRAGSPRAGNAGNAVAQDRLSRQQGASASPRQGASGFSSPSAGPAGSSARLSSGYRPSASDVLRSVGEGGSGVEGGLGIGGGEGSLVGASGGSLGVAGGAVGVQGANAGTPAASVAAVTSVAPDELCTACEGLSGAEAEALLARPGASVRSVAFGARLPEVGAWIALAEAAGAHLSAAAGADAKAGGREIAAALTGLSDPEQMSAAEQDRLIALARADKTLGAARAALEALFGARRAEALELLKERAEDVSGASAATTLYSRLRGAGMTPQEVDAAVSAYNLSVTISLPPEPGAPPQTYTIQVQTPYHISTRKRTPASPAASASPTATQVARQDGSPLRSGTPPSPPPPTRPLGRRGAPLRPR